MKQYFIEGVTHDGATIEIMAYSGVGMNESVYRRDALVIFDALSDTVPIGTMKELFVLMKADSRIPLSRRRGGLE